MENKNGFDMEDFLKKMLDEAKEDDSGLDSHKKNTCDHCGGDLDGDKDFSSAAGIKMMLSFMEKGELIRLAKAAKDKTDEIFEEIRAALVDKSEDPDKQRGLLSHMIVKKASELEILNVFMIAAGTSVLPTDDYNDKIDLIVRLCK